MTPKEDERDNDEGDEYNDRSPAIVFTKRLVDLLTCEICLNLLSDPITTTCQHTFCATCLQRSLDHSPLCPLCRCHFPSISQYYTYETNQTISSLLQLLSTKTPSTTPTQPTDPDLDTPIFVCQLSFPGMPTILHIFEPRYRLMLRAVLKGEKPRFGMIMYPSQEGVVVNYGTMLDIKSVKILSDGRSVIETWGTDRFRLVKRGERDGYMVGKIETIQDLPAAMEREIEKNATLHIPPRTPPIAPVADPMEVFGISPRARTSVSPTPSEAQAPLVGTRRRSTSPAPSIASISTISTISSIRSAPSTSAAGTSRWHSPSSSYSQTLRRSGTPSAPALGQQQQQAHHGTSASTHSLDSQGSSSSAYNYPIEPTTDELAETCRVFIQRLRKGSSPLVIQRLNTVGPEPEDYGLLSFWIAQLLPIDEGEKAKLLPIRSPRLRLRLVVHWIDQFNAAWWFSGCIIA
ncbi:hypothetical protein CPB86DRAFT_712528 [Serendipita vermifera]|nr:hypothetical protein CPB86DRAFT_712528 [Serendipita vermifera]